MYLHKKDIIAELRDLLGGQLYVKEKQQLLSLIAPLHTLDLTEPVCNNYWHLVVKLGIVTFLKPSTPTI